MIDREDMLELTRRMTPKRTSMQRIAGAYVDRDGEIDGTFNINFLKLSLTEKENNLTIAKQIPFSKTNEQLKEYRIRPDKQGQNSIYQLLQALKDCGLKNDALMDVLYDQICAVYRPKRAYAFYLFYGVYDIPVKFGDKDSYYESEEVYEYLIGALCPLVGEYEPGLPEWGFLFPAYSDRSADITSVDIFEQNPFEPHIDLMELMGII